MAIVKAFAYGTDAERISHFLHTCGIDIVGVSYVHEGIHLHQAGIPQEIFVLHAAEHEIEEAIKNDLQIGVSTYSQILSAQKIAHTNKKHLKAHLHVDTGMKRFGCSPDEAYSLAQTIAQSPNLLFEGLFTHFVAAEDPNFDEVTIHQNNLLLDCLNAISTAPRYVHASNSAGTLRFNFTHFNMIRVGLAIYGIYPSLACLSSLKPALSLFSRIAGFSYAKKNETVGYGRKHICHAEETKIAIMPIGYCDGLHRHYSEKIEVLIRGKRAPLIGKICMDHTMVDVSHIPECNIGDLVCIFGEDEHGNTIAAEDIAAAGDSIAHELIACLGSRIKRVFV